MRFAVYSSSSFSSSIGLHFQLPIDRAEDSHRIGSSKYFFRLSLEERLPYKV